MGNPKKVMDIPLDFRNGPVPMVVLLEHHAREGWQRASAERDSLAIHTLDPPRIMHLCGSLAQDKAYLQCLCCLKDILSPSVPALATGRSAEYYKTILQPPLELALPAPPSPVIRRHEAGARDSSEEEPILEQLTEPWAGQPTPPGPAASGRRRGPRASTRPLWCPCPRLRPAGVRNASKQWPRHRHR